VDRSLVHDCVWGQVINTWPPRKHTEIARRGRKWQHRRARDGLGQHIVPDGNLELGKTHQEKAVTLAFPRLKLESQLLMPCRSIQQAYVGGFVAP